MKATPEESEIDGVRLDTLKAGTVREVSSTFGFWLVAQGYAVPEMRHDPGSAAPADLRAFIEKRRNRHRRKD
jgi:hypothetical protein